MSESDDDQRDDGRSQGYKSEGTSRVISPVMNEIEDCDSGYFFDGKSRRCIGDYFLISNNIFGS